MKNNKINIVNGILNLISSILFVVSAILNFNYSDNNMFGAAYIALSVVFFSLSIFYFIKSKNKK